MGHDSEVREDASVIRTGFTWTCTWWTSDEHGEVPPGYWDGWHATMQIRKPTAAGIAGGGEVIATLASAGAPVVIKQGDLILEPEGNVIAVMSDEQTADLEPERRAVFDLKLTGPDGVALPAVEGFIQIRKGVTE